MNVCVIVGSLFHVKVGLNVKDVSNENEDSFDEKSVVLAPVLPVLKTSTTSIKNTSSKILLSLTN